MHEYLFCTDSANIFYQPLPKGGEGERDTGITSGEGVTRHVARGYLLTYSLDWWRRCWVSSPPPPPYTLTPFGQFETSAADLEDSL